MADKVNLLGRAFVLSTIFTIKFPGKKGLVVLRASHEFIDEMKRTKEELKGTK